MKASILKNKLFYNICIVPLVIIIAGFIRSICVKIFIEPHNFAPGGATGIATMISYATNYTFPTGWIYLIINAPLIVIAFIFIGKSFAIKTGAAIGMSSLSMVLLDYVDFTSLVVENPVLSALASGSLGGIGLALMLKIGGSTGGSDIIAVCIQKKLSATNVSWFIYGIDAMIVFVSAFVYRDGLNPVLISLVEMFCLAKMTDVITSGFKTALKYEIITKDPEPLAQDILHKLHRGVTCTKVMGMYSHDERYMLTCIIRKHQLSEFNKLMQQYPDSFAYLSNTREVVGLGFSRAVELKINAEDSAAEDKAAAEKAQADNQNIIAADEAVPQTEHIVEPAAVDTPKIEEQNIAVASDTAQAEEQTAAEE